jgi:hypothetical protein
VSAHATTSVVTAEAFVNLDGSGTWSIDGTTEPITASTAPAAREEALRRTALAAAERGTAIELTAVLAGVPTFLRVSPTGEVTRFEGSGFPPAPATSSPGTDPSPPTVTNRHVPSNEGGPRRRWVVAAAGAGCLAVALVAGLLLLRDTGGGSPSPSAAPTPATGGSTPAASPPPSTVMPAVVRRKLDARVTARKGGPLTAQVRATAAPTVVAVTVWREGRMIATRRLHLTVARPAWSSGTITFENVGPGRYRWAATAPGAPRVSGTYTVLVRPAPQDRRLHQSSSTGSVGRTSPTRAWAPSPSASPPPASQQPSTPQPSTPPSTAGTRRPAPHHGPVPGGGTSSPHPGPTP